jgi:putative tricarboxylic transport membrane protein
MIGYDSIQGVDRFIFSDYLTGGVHIIPALIGLFAIPQIIEMVEGGRYKRSYDLIEVRPHSVWKSAIETVSSVRAWVIGSISGIIVGLIPGAGGQIAGLVAYDQTRRFSPNGHKFGTGEPEGVISAESANNAMVGPSLVPLLTLSVPGSPTAAVLLGGLLIHGIFPGPNLFTNHPDVAWAFINSLLIGQALMLVFGLYIAGLAAHVVRIPPAILASGVLVLAVFGAYSVQNSQGDVVVMLMLGLGMYFLQQYGFSAAPLVLGVILGPIAETNYVQGRIIAGASDGMFAYFFTGPLNLLLIAFVVFSIIYSIVSEVRWRRSEAQRIGDAQGAAI